MANIEPLTLPITITQDGIQIDENFLVITKANAFLTRQLRKYYLSTASVYPKVVYRTFWLEEKFPGTLEQLGMKVKVTTLFADVIGIEFAKTKTIYSKCHARLLEVIQGKGMLLLQQDTMSALDEASTYVIDLVPGGKTVIPPNWHYTLVNTSKETLATVEMYKSEQELNSCSGDKKGSGVYVIERNGIPEIVKNSQYKNLVKYVTVDSESYATNFNVDNSKTLSEQVAAIAECCYNDIDPNWQLLLDTANSGNYPF